MGNRQNYFVNKSFQTRFALELAAIVLLVPIAIWVNYFILGQYILIDELGGPQSEFSWGIITGLLAGQWPVVLTLYFVNVLLVGFLLVRYAHRVAGPIYRYEEALAGMSVCSKKVYVTLRPADYFPEVGKSIEKLCRSVEKDLDDLENVAKVISSNDQNGLQQHANTMKSVLARVRSD
jgi:hypothetical protein